MTTEKIRYIIEATIIFLFIAGFQSCNPGTSISAKDDPRFKWEEPVMLSAQDQKLGESIDTFFQHKVHRTGLNACVLVAHEGNVIYSNCFGYADYYKKKKLNDSSEFQLASVSKPFTATAILMLEERKQMNLDDAVSKYIEGFPYEGITIRTLLNHRSGLANYIYLFDTLKSASGDFISNEDVVQYFVKNKPALQATPNRKFQYCNTNYALLAYIVEKVSRHSFGDFIRENIFLPSHMAHSYIQSVSDTTPHPDLAFSYTGSRWEKVSSVPYDGVLGDKGVFTTTHDLYLFDQALNNGILLQKETLEEAYKGYSYEKPGLKNYGLGWRLKEFPDSSRIIYHNGWWRGYNSLFVRNPTKGICIIILANKYNRSTYDISTLYELLNVADGDITASEQ